MVVRERTALGLAPGRALRAERPKPKPQRRPEPPQASSPPAMPAATSASLPKRRATRPARATPSSGRNAAASMPDRGARRALQPPTAAKNTPTPQTDWLGVRNGALCTPDGQRVQLRGVQLPLELHGAAAPAADAAALQDARTLLAEVPPGQRCVAVRLHLVAQLQPAALAALDRHIAHLSRAGTYTLLRLEARLWMHDFHVRLARRYAGRSAVMFGLMGRSALSSRLTEAMQGVHAVHPRALVWLPLASAANALQQGFEQGLGLLWDAERPQGPHASLLTAAMHHPVLLDGWQPQALSALAQERLITLCARGGIGWLASSGEPWLARERGQPVLSRSARCVQRAVYLSGAFQSGAQVMRPSHLSHPLAFQPKEFPWL